MKSRALRCSMSERVVHFLLTLGIELLKPVQSFAKAAQQAVHMFATRGCLHGCSSFVTYQDRAECKPRATFSSLFPLGCQFHVSFLSGTGLLAWKPYIVPQLCLKACARWKGSLPRMRRKMLSRTRSRLQMMGFPVGVV